MEATVVSKNQMINDLLKIGHRDLDIYAEKGLHVAESDSELFGHMIAWNAKKGTVRDSEKALPVIALRKTHDVQLCENAAAHLCLLDVRDLVAAVRFHRHLDGTNGAKWIKTAVKRYIHEREKNQKWWDKTAVMHRRSFKTLYAMNHIKPTRRAQNILFDKNYPAGSVFDRIRQLKNMPPKEAAGTILNYNLPQIAIMGALDKVKGNTDLMLALIEQMTPAQLVTKSKMFKNWGVFDSEILTDAYNEGLSKKKMKGSSLKAGVAAKAVGDKKIAKKLEAVQQKSLGNIEGAWLVLADRSSSMRTSIQVAKHVSALLASRVKGEIYLVFFNDQPRMFDVTGKRLEEIELMTKHISATGSTSIGVGLDYILKRGLVVNGIAICSDGGEWVNPRFHKVYAKYTVKMNIEPTVYLFHVPGDPDHFSRSCQNANLPIETFELGEHVDYNSLPNLISVMRTNRYSLIDEILETPLLTFNKVFERRQK